MVNKSHVRSKHDLTWDEYESYGEVKLVDDSGEPIESIWDSIDTSHIEFRIKNRTLGNRIVEISNRRCVDLRQGRNCYGCVQKIESIAVYVILHTENELKLETPEYMKKPYHKKCAMAVASKTSKIGIVMNPVE